MKRYYQNIQNAIQIPEYYKAHCEDVLDRLRKERADGKYPVSFAFVTDTHIHWASMSFVPLLKELALNGQVGKVFCGGDLPWAFGSKEMCLNDSAVSLALMGTLREYTDFYMIRGNHDFTIRTSREESSGYTAPYDETRRMLLSVKSDGGKGPDNRVYYYVDDADNKVRYVLMDTCTVESGAEDEPWGTRYGFDEEERIWLETEALQLPDNGQGWAVIALGHIPCVKELPSYSDTLDGLAETLKDFRNRRAGKYADFSRTEAEFVAYLCGHNHKDRACVEEDTLFISTTSSSCLPDDCWPREFGTVSEEAFDVYLLDQASRRLRAVRVGAGESRMFSYAEGMAGQEQ